MRVAHHCGLCRPGVSHQRMLHLSAANPVARDVDDIVHAARDPVEAILVPNAAIASEVVAWVRPQIRIQHALVVTVHRAEHRGPRLGKDQDPSHVVALQLFAARGVQHPGVHAKHGEGAGARLHHVAAWHGCHHEAASLSLPERIHDGAPLIANHLIVPAPGLGVYGLAHGAQHTEGGPVILLHPVRAGAHERADRRGRGVELRDLVALDHVPVTARVRIRGHRLKHKGRDSVCQRPVDDVGVAGDPANVGHRAIAVSHVQVEDCAHGEGGPQDIPGCAVRHSLRLACGA
mmetsp:Transcript_97909/g.285675  ORF Transcript_97909/g.285675 Transcript_97909/m.285675 type:complete len:290 (-) Transcript_97909:77-946(-)